MTNVVSLYDDETTYDVDYNLQDKALDKLFKSGKFIIVHELEDGCIRYNVGKDMTVGDLSYFQKVLNLRTDERIQFNMYKELDE